MRSSHELSGEGATQGKGIFCGLGAGHACTGRSAALQLTCSQCSCSVINRFKSSVHINLDFRVHHLNTGHQYCELGVSLGACFPYGAVVPPLDAIVERHSP